MNLRHYISQRIKCSLLSLGLLLCVPTFIGATELVGGIEPKLQEEEVIQALKQGGYVIYFRHGATTKSGEKDVEKNDLANCDIQRNLSPEGRAQTKAVGVALKRHKIPIGRVYTSPYCRCVDTAVNMFGKARKSDALHFAIHTSKEQRQEITQKLLGMLATAPLDRTNTAIVSHTSNLNNAVKIFPRPEGVAHIFKPEQEGKFSYIGMVQPKTWMTSKALPTMANTDGDSQQGWFSSIRQWFTQLF